MEKLIPYFAVITAAVAAYLAFRHQQRLKAFELFYSRRAAVLSDIEVQIERLYEIKKTIRERANHSYAEFGDRAFLDGVILYNKVIGANFGHTASILAHTYLTIIQEPLGSRKDINFEDWIQRLTNSLTILYASAHSHMSRQTESLTMSLPQRLLHAASGLRRERGERSRQTQIPN